MTDATMSAEELAASPAAAAPSDAGPGSESTAEAPRSAAVTEGIDLEQGSEAGSDSDFDAEAEAEQDPEAADGADLQMAGGTLSDEELAAVTALLGTLAGASGTEGNGAGSAGPTDRTLQRRRRLGLWGRPGPDSWKHAAGLR
ncbi:acyl-CoA carboxylase epsilon subunit [Nesterenkonia sp. CF4.4]|uniref:acyl-CoA carboxylase epsilon subunit n=1 Tax=Nesterenkonia sp. CF4.4 TaxID=3373079 RepID=UPI003EE4DD11